MEIDLDKTVYELLKEDASGKVMVQLHRELTELRADLQANKAWTGDTKSQRDWAGLVRALDAAEQVLDHAEQMIPRRG